MDNRQDGVGKYVSVQPRSNHGLFPLASFPCKPLAAYTLNPCPCRLTCSVIPNSTKIFVNGVWVGIHREPQTLVRTLRHLRRQMDVNTEVSVCVVGSGKGEKCFGTWGESPHSHAHTL